MNINIEIFKRNIKLKELGVVDLSNDEQELFDSLNKHLSNLSKYYGHVATDIHYGKSSEEIIIQYDSLTNYLFYDTKYSIYLTMMFDIERYMVSELIIWWFINYYKMNIKNALPSIFINSKYVYL